MNTRESVLPLVSVITLANHSVYLQETVSSVLGQSYHPIEYIISDDVTPDFNVKYQKQKPI